MMFLCLICWRSSVVEQGFHKAKVAGSIPAASTKIKLGSLSIWFCFSCFGAGIEPERGRENGSFPVAELFKPRGLKSEAREIPCRQHQILRF